MRIVTLLLGTIIGSFLNVCIYRIPLKESIAFPPSHCSKCNTSLRALDLVPVCSFLFIKGKCRYCGEKISYQYPLIELLNGLLYLWVYLKFGLTLEFLAYSILCSILIVVGIIDYYHQVIPDTINIFGFVCGFIFHTINFSSLLNFLQYLFGFLVGGGFLLLIAVVTKGAMGGGDIKLMAMLGFWLGWKFTLLNLFQSFILGGFISIILILLKFKDVKDMIPFGPFIVLATLITLFYGNDIISYYIMTFVVY
ncbi:prepilin peptidase [Alkaliphilus sp. MSJ-5]|uniref:Prepilin peptidase n=1 Tax=Alkaliphilus flagellatus TaxID=2841507 RepID=A0ABS6G544_9FIRM|nr:A24 family peptidase [Alkaliphilus flagellatus]MBU5677587.1 prepilin peptidase [Alkaliphilus flagellatus]